MAQDTRNRKRDEILRHEPEVVRRRPITQRNMTMGGAVAPKPADADEEVFGAPRQSSVVEVKRDRTPKGVTDGRGKRSVKDMLLSMPHDEAQSVYAMERIAALEDGIVKILELCTPGAREIIFKRRESIKRFYG